MKGITKKEFDAFIEEMWERLKKGEKKYGSEFIENNLAISMVEEATDLANYSFMLFLKANKFNKKYIK